MTLEVPSAFVPTPRSGLTRRRLLRNGLGLTGMAGVILPGSAAYGAVEAANDLVITEYHPVPPNWPDSHRLTITVIADLHAGGPNMGIARVRQVVDAGNALGSDLLVILGDYFATHNFVTERVPHAAWAAELARLKAPLGVYAILGNHDWRYDFEGTRAALRHVGIPPMQNDAVLLGAPGKRFWLAGLDDQIGIGSDRIVMKAPMTCRARSPKFTATTRSSCWRTSRISSGRCRPVSR
jgi:hypothetical protein